MLSEDNYNKRRVK